MPSSISPQAIRLAVLLVVVFAAALATDARAADISLTPLNSEHRVWTRSDFRLEGVPTAANPFDPEVIAVDVTFTGPSGKALTLPAFWYQGYTRALDGNTEKLTAQGAASWRVRWTPVEAGAHRWRVSVVQPGKALLSGEGKISVGARSQGARGFVRVEPKEKRYFQTDDGSPLPLLGENACWHGNRGTYDYDDWFAGFRSAGMNYTRLWMWNKAFGIEFFGDERLKYNQERAWRLDYVLDQATRSGIYVMLCLDYHGIFQVEPDMWGSNNWWPQHAYNETTGGPCKTQNDFFTSETARILYRKRLRYLIARYGAEPGLMSWQFFNEIDNVYRFLKPADVVAWHDTMAQWLKANDPYQHPVTTSFGSAGDHPEMWKLGSLDYAQYHLYFNWAAGMPKQPGEMAKAVGTDFRQRYGKPMYVGEFGTHGGGADLMDQADPQYRGLQQALWAGIFGGTAGTAMPWWWERIHGKKLYPLWGALNKFLDGTGFGTADWRPLEVSAPRMSPSLGEIEAGGTPFSETIAVIGRWGDRPTGRLVVRRPGDGNDAPLHPFLHGSAKPELQVPFVINAALAPGAKLVVHVNSVSNDGVLAVTANGREIFRRPLPDKDGKTEVVNEYNEDIEVPLPAGTQEIEIKNVGSDWINVDRIALSGVLPTRPSRQDGIPLDVYGLTDGKSALIWSIDPSFHYPRGVNGTGEMVEGATVTVHGLPDGNYEAEWWNTREGHVLGTTRGRSESGKMALPVAAFAIDTAARVRRR